VVNANWWPEFLDNDSSFVPGPFKLHATLNISGTSFFAGEKGGVAPTVTRQYGEKRSFEEIPNSASTAATVAATKDAFIFDTGDEGSWQIWPLNDASAFHSNATLLKNWLNLPNQGFTVYRRSQWAGSVHAGYIAEEDRTMVDGLRQSLQQWDDWYTNNPPNPGTSHEFFMYINGHGSNGGFLVIYPRSGDKNKREWVTYSALAGWLNDFPAHVKIIVFIDSCYSGAAIETAAGPLRVLCENGRKATVITSADATHSVPTGRLPILDPPIVDFMQGEEIDHDNDRKKGDFYDRYREMFSQSWGRNPQRYLCPGQNSMCSTD
jgi:hypothetical protein